MSEPTEAHATIEQARNAAIAWMEQKGVTFGTHRKVEVCSLGVSPLLGNEVGVSSSTTPYWRLRLDWDPDKQGHYNAEVGKGGAREKRAFTFPATEDQIRRIGDRRGNR
ncbi:MAG: hypothetical protein AAGF12_10755 [Myxococcota bacterium]